MTVLGHNSDTTRGALNPLRRLLLPIYLPSALMAVAQMALLMVLPLYMLELGTGLTVTALVFAMRSLGSVVVNVPASLAIARYGHRVSMAVANGMIGLSALFISTASSSWVIATAALLFGAGMGSWLLARLAYITEQIPNHQRGTALSMLAGLQRLGMFTGPLLGGLGVETAGYRVIFTVISVTALATATLIWLFAATGSSTPSGHHQAELPSSTGNQTRSNNRPTYGLATLIPSILRRYRALFVTAGVFVFALQLVREQRRLLVVLWGTRIGLDAEAIGLIVSTAAAVDMAMFPLAGYSMDHWGRKVAGVSCIGLLSIALGLLPLTTTALPYLLVAILAGIGNGFGSGIILTMGADLAPADEPSQFLGVWRMIGDLGALVGPLLTSIAASLMVALQLSALVGLTGGAVLAFCVNETLSRPSTR
ncbi:MAG: MFS transporter [Acidobacteriota bacterium]|nr:MFS transporter [Acidobacteriota bacterium]